MLLAHPKVLKEGPGSLAALFTRWVPPPLSHGYGPYSRVPDVWLQHRFFTGAAENWLDAAGKAWVKAGLMPNALPSARWLDGRYVPRVKALPGDVSEGSIRWRVPASGRGLH